MFVDYQTILKICNRPDCGFSQNRSAIMQDDRSAIMPSLGEWARTGYLVQAFCIHKRTRACQKLRDSVSCRHRVSARALAKWRESMMRYILCIHVCKYEYTFVYTFIYTCMYLYILDCRERVKDRERERERKRKTASARSRSEKKRGPVIETC